MVFHKTGEATETPPPPPLSPLRILQLDAGERQQKMLQAILCFPWLTHFRHPLIASLANPLQHWVSESTSSCLEIVWGCIRSLATLKQKRVIWVFEAQGLKLAFYGSWLVSRNSYFSSDYSNEVTCALSFSVHLEELLSPKTWKKLAATRPWMPVTKE